MGNQSNSPYIPPDPVDVPIRPLSKGVFLDLPANSIDKGGFSYLNNFYITHKGLKRRLPWIPYLQGTAIPNLGSTKLIDMQGFWKTNETTALALLTSDYLYLLTDLTATPLYWKYTTGTIYPSGTTVYGAGTLWSTAASQIRAGDMLVIDPSGTPSEHAIAEVVGETELTLSTAYTGATSGPELFTYGNGENANSPTLDGGTSDLTQATWTRAMFSKTGTFSWLLEKTSALASKVSLTDTGEAGTTDMHGLTPGAHYLLSFWAQIDDYTKAANISVVFQEYYSGAWHDTYTWGPPATQESESVWLNNIFNIEIGASTTGVNLQVRSGAGGGLIFLDDFSLKATQVFNCEIRRTFKPNSDGNLDTTMAVNNGTNLLLIADGQRPPYKFDGATLDCLDTSLTYHPNVICWYKERVFIANVTEGADTFTQRIRWSSVTDYTSFGATDFMDLPYTTAAIRRMLPLKQYLIVYTGTGVYFGRPTTQPSLPVVFDLLPNSSAGLAGQRAVVSWLGGHFYAGRSDIHFLDENGEIKQLGSKTVKSLLEKCSAPQHIQACVDIANSRVVFGIPQSQDNIEVLASFYYTTGAWGVEYLSIDFLASPNSYIGMNWDNIDTFTPYTPGDPEGWDSANGIESFGYWDAIGGHEESVGIYTGKNAYIYKQGSTGGVDVDSVLGNMNIPAEFITPEYDFDEIDDEKTFLRFSLKLAERPSSTLTTAVYASYDGGYNWNFLGNLMIDNAHREGKVDFTTTASAVMFRGVSTSAVNPYESIEYCVRVQGRGKEVHFS